MRISDWSSDVCSSDLMPGMSGLQLAEAIEDRCQLVFCTAYDSFAIDAFGLNALDYLVKPVVPERLAKTLERVRSEEHTSELQSLMRISYAVFCLKKKRHIRYTRTN